ncbi:dynamin family protein [Yoonia maritima]|uniref:Dynamin family protein n=1 Tax=Yoonia maritima TaxID=1435347 RepID=A0A2T0W0G0_9RHOB|nr:dynamin family protein [Yoonia maritima]PRY78249.1 dynamin family protein [Yoonia maritima]
MVTPATVQSHRRALDKFELTKSKDAKRAIEQLVRVSDKMEKMVVPGALDRTLEIQKRLSKFETRISLVGQVKAGKTALANAMIGQPGLLPSDVNPWTSVITSLHMNTAQPAGKSAVFQFFDKEEWSEMTTMGGRLGELAARTNFEDEAEEMRDQVRELQGRAKQRLGVNFKLLLGNTHSFGEFDHGLVKRYVCLGDDDETGNGSNGRFADLTKSADLYFDNPQFPLPVVIRDTPGVNDPFLVREAVTLNNLAETDICVICLSAHQALSTVDIGLINIIMGLQHEQIILFVNRIDELEDPHRQINEIDSYIRRTLKTQKLPQDIPIVFGSAKWGQADISGDYDALSEQSRAAYQSLKDSRASSGNVTRLPNGKSAVESDLSGISQLMKVIDAKSAHDVSWPFIEKLRDECLDLVNQSTLLLRDAVGSQNTAGATMSASDLSARIAQIISKLNDDYDALTKSSLKMTTYAMSDVYRSFILNGKRDLEKLVDKGEGLKQWSPETETLRRDLISAYNNFSNKCTAQLREIMQETADSIAGLYADVLGTESGLFPVVGPTFSRPKTPVFLMKTMTIDLSTGWLGRMFSKQRKKATYVANFEKLATEEMAATIHDLQQDYIQEFATQTRVQLQGFMDEHIKTLRNLVLPADAPEVAQMRQSFGLEREVTQRIAALDEIRDALHHVTRHDCDISHLSVTAI